MKLSRALPLVLALPIHAHAPSEQDGQVLVVYSSGIQALLDDPKDRGLQAALEMLDERLVELGLDLEHQGFPAEGIQFAHELLKSPMCLRVGMQDPGDPTSVQAQLTVQCESTVKAGSLADQVAQFFRSSGLRSQAVEGSPGLFSAFTPLGPLRFGQTETDKGPAFVFSLGEGTSESFTFANDVLPEGVTPKAYARFDGRSLGTLLEPFVGARMEAGVFQALEFLGLIGDNAVARTWALGYEEGRAVAGARVEGYVPLAKRHGSFTAETLGSEDFRRIPLDATFVKMCQVRASGALGILAAIEPDMPDKVRQMGQAICGIDLQAEFLDQLGPTLGFYGSQGTGGGGFLSTVVFCEVQDADVLRTSLDRILHLAQAAALEPTGGRVSLRSWSHGGAPCSSLTFPGLPIPVELSYTVSADALYVTFSRNALRAALDQTRREGSLADHPSVRGLREREGQGLVKFGFVDTPYFARQGYGTSTLVATGLGNAMRSPYDPDRDPGDILPSMGELLRDVQPMVAWGKIEGSDLVEASSFERSWAVNGTALAGTPLSQSYAGIAGVGILSSVAIPNLMSARLSANENAAIATLRNIASAQAQMQAIGVIDRDGDGQGEFGFLGEMAGVVPLRGSRGGRMQPALLGSSFGNRLNDGNQGAVVQRSGYCFKVWIGGSGGRGAVQGVPEPMRPSNEGDPDNAEQFWCAYAWPMTAGQTGNRVFFIDQSGQLTACGNEAGQYQGLHAQPSFDSALRGPALGTAPVRGKVARDGQVWKLVH